MKHMFPWNEDAPLPGNFLANLLESTSAGGLFVYPADNLYGLGASIHSERGIARLNALKGRPPGMPTSVMASAEQITELCIIPKAAAPFMESADLRITAVLPAKESAPNWIIHRGTLAVRFPCSALTASLVECLGPVTATSANRHGVPTPTDIEGAVNQLGEGVYAYIDSGILAGKPTTIIDYTGRTHKIIREGSLPADEAGKIHGR